MPALGPDEVTALLQQRLAAVEAAIAETRATIAEHTPRVPRLFLIEEEYDVAIMTAEAGWMRALIAELTEGTLPGLAQWRQVHETGVIPEDLRRMAEGH
jgi:hypothetical protein